MRTPGRGAQRSAAIAGALIVAVGTGLIVGFSQYRTELFEWVVSDPDQASGRLMLVMAGLALLLGAPLVAFAAYTWRLGGRVLSTGVFPPPGYRLLRETPAIRGTQARLRGQVLRGLALALATATLVLWLMLWWIAVRLAAR